MKKIILVIAFLIVATVSFAQGYTGNLYCATYTSNIRDSVAVAGSTNGGSDWFINKGFNEIYLQLHNGTDWYLYKLDLCGAEFVDKFSIYHYGADSTVGVYAYLPSGQSMLVPLKYGFSATPVYKLDIGVTSRWMVQFWGVKSRD